MLSKGVRIATLLALTCLVYFVVAQNAAIKGESIHIDVTSLSTQEIEEQLQVSRPIYTMSTRFIDSFTSNVQSSSLCPLTKRRLNQQPPPSSSKASLSCSHSLALH